MNSKVALYLTCSASINNEERFMISVAKYFRKDFEIFKELNLEERPIRKKLLSNPNVFEAIYFYGIVESFSDIDDFIIFTNQLINRRISFYIVEQRINYEYYGDNYPILRALYKLWKQDSNNEFEIKEFKIEETSPQRENINNNHRPHAV
jgi:hypothetical protein